MIANVDQDGVTIEIRKLRWLLGLSTGYSVGAISVAIGGKADMACCSAYVAF
jgi:hypothetical protein